MSSKDQFNLSFPALIDHEVDGEHIHQRPKDGYINATEMCKADEKQWSNYAQNASSKAFIDELSRSLGIPRDSLIQQISTGSNESRGTWVHPQVAINLGQWLSPKFAVWVTQRIQEWVEGTTKGYMPPHVKRYMMNKAKVPATHFSMLNEVYLELLAPIDDAGVIIPKKVVPDISTGKMFSGFLRDQGIEPNNFPTYKHDYPDGRIVDARLYPVELLSKFRVWLNNEWLPKRAIDYFKERLPDALPHIQHLLSPPDNTQKSLGRPARQIEGIEDKSENVAKAIMQNPPKEK